ncbi:MAG: ATP-binding protein [Marivita lacus]|nr:ATP-binding protein [Marivita lacus]
MTVLSERLDVICDFIRDASASFMVIDGEGVCLFANHAIQQLNVSGPLSRYFNGDAGRATLKAGAGQSTPLPFSFEGAKGRQRANIRRITPATEEVILLVKIIQSARMAAFTMASQSEGAAALQAYHKRRVSDRFGAFFNTAREGNAIRNRAGGFVYGNPALLRLVGLTEDELTRKTLFDVISEDSVAAQIIGTGATRVDLSRIAPSQFDATLHGPQRDIPVSVSLGSNGSESSPEFFLTLRDLTDSRRFAEVKKLNSELDMANKAMDEFNRLMSHEMRAPLSKLVSIAENLRSFGKLGAEADRYVTMIEEAAKDALLQYSSILSMSRGSKREIVQFRPVELVERLMRQHALIAEHHQVRLNGAISGDRHASVPVDATDVFLIMTNLVSNALKHTTAGDAVVFSITVHEDSRSLELQVRDTGTGISEALRPRIYDAFVTTAAEMEIQSGVGVGLALVKRAVELRKGTIDFTSELGKGTTFTVMLPFAEGDVERVEPEEIGSVANGLNLAPGDTILVIDDDVVNLQILSARLAAYGYKVLTATGGTGALRILKTAQDTWPKLIFIDRNMPNLNGMETTRIIRSRFRARDSFICGLTAYVDHEIVKDMTLAGMNCVEQKPLSNQSLEKYLKPDRARTDVVHRLPRSA